MASSSGSNNGRYVVVVESRGTGTSVGLSVAPNPLAP